MSTSPVASDTPARKEQHGSRRGYLWLIGAILLFLLQVLPFLSYRFVTDESWYAGPAYTLAHADGIRDPGMGPNEQENHFDGRPPGSFVVIAAFFRVAGTSAATARLASVCAGMAIIALTFLLTRDPLGDAGAALASLLVATDNLIVLVARSARPEALTIMAVLAALLAIKRYNGTRQLTWAVLAGLLLAVGASFHVTMLGYVLSVGLLAVAIDRNAGGFPLRGALAFSFGWLAGLCPLVVWFVASPMHRAGFREEFVGKAKGTPLPIRAVHEFHRYNDLFGFNTLPGHAFQALPARLPIPLFFLFASYLLWKHRRAWFYAELICLLPTMLWFAYTANKSSRYLSLVAPILAITIAAAVADAYRKQRRWKLLSSLAALVVLMQFGANLVLLRGASKANYDQVEADLRRLIPADQTAYGTITFWLGLRDGPYVAYERTTPLQAIRDFHARYFILGDPMMANGSKWDQPYYDDLNASLAAVAAHSSLVGTVPSAYYGELKVYRLDDSSAVLPAAR